MTTKFRVVQRSIIAAPEKATSVTKAACCLHNYLRICEMYNPTSSSPYCPPGYADQEDSHGNVILGDWRADKDRCTAKYTLCWKQHFSHSAAAVQDSVMNFLTSPEGIILAVQPYL